MSLMKKTHFILFDTAIGRCGIAWSQDGVVGVQFPEGPERATRARLMRRFPGAEEEAAPAAIEHTIAGIVALLAGERRELKDVTLDMGAIPAFDRRVYEIARDIPPGETLSYGEIARRLGGEPQIARDVGQALGRNPFPIIVPCHRVLAAHGKFGGFSARGGVSTKRRLLSIEGALASDSLPLFAERPVVGE